MTRRIARFILMHYPLMLLHRLTHHAYIAYEGGELQIFNPRCWFCDHAA